MPLLLLISYSIISIPEVNKILDLSDSLDVKALRAVRVLRPLKLISGVPSKFRTVSKELLILFFLHHEKRVGFSGLCHSNTTVKEKKFQINTKT